MWEIVSNESLSVEGFPVLEFLVDSVEPSGIVFGLNGGRDIPVGTVFTAVRRERVQKIPDGYRTEDLGLIGTVSLVLREVHWYSHVIESVPARHSAGLVVEGKGLTELAEWIGALPASEYQLYLVASE